MALPPTGVAAHFADAHLSLGDWGGRVIAGLLALLMTGVSVAPIGGANALTLPAQRHLVRFEGSSGPVWLLAVQQDGASGHGLVLLRARGDGQPFELDAPIQDDPSERDTADLVAVGADLAMAYGYEGPMLTGSERHDVFFQWWRAAGDDWQPQPPVKVFDSTSSTTAYSRALLAIDSQGRIWVQAFRLEADGTSTLVIAVSTDGGVTFTAQPPLAHLPRRGGGRLVSLGDRLLMLYAMHDGFEPTHFRQRSDSDDVGTWGPEQQAFPEGIYHGAALSAVVTPSGMHLLYKSENDLRLYHRFFDGTAFGAPTLLEDTGDWALQPAATAVGDDLFVAYNHPVVSGASDELRARVLHAGSWSDPIALEPGGDFKGYPAAAERLAQGTVSVPFFYGESPGPRSAGNLTMTSLANPFASSATSSSGSTSGSSSGTSSGSTGGAGSSGSASGSSGGSTGSASSTGRTVGGGGVPRPSRGGCGGCSGGAASTPALLSLALLMLKARTRRRVR